MAWWLCAPAHHRPRVTSVKSSEALIVVLLLETTSVSAALAFSRIRATLCRDGCQSKRFPGFASTCLPTCRPEPQWPAVIASVKSLSQILISASVEKQHLQLKGQGGQGPPCPPRYWAVAFKNGSGLCSRLLFGFKITVCRSAFVFDSWPCDLLLLFNLINSISPSTARDSGLNASWHISSTWF